MPDSHGDPLDRLPREFHPEAILEALNSHGVQYVVVGGMAAVLHGAEVSTIDLDVVLEQSRANRDRAVDALWSLDAERVTYTRDIATAGEQVPENGDGLTERIESFRTRDGDVDLLRDALVIGGYNDLRNDAHVFFVDDQEVCVADLDAVIVAKEASSEAKDQLHLRSLYDLRDALERDTESDPEYLARAKEPGRSPNREAGGGLDAARAAIDRASRVSEAIEQEREPPEPPTIDQAPDISPEIER